MPKYRRGCGSVYTKRGWCYIKYHVNREPVTESTGTKDKAEARRLLQVRLGQVAEGRFVGLTAERLTFEDLAKGLLDDYRANDRKTVSWVERRIHLHLAPFFRGRKAKEIATPTVTEYIARRQHAGAKNGTINLELAALKRMFSLAVQADYLAKRPYIPHLLENNVRQGFFEQQEFNAVLAHLPMYLRPVMTLAYQLGWRARSEILPLTWEQIDIQLGAVRLEVGSTKNRDGRLIYLPQYSRSVIEDQWRQHQDLHPECPYVFQRDGNRIRAYQRAWTKARRETGLLGKVPHDFGRTAVRNMVRAGIPERVAMQISGHKTRAIFDRYHVVSDQDLKEAAQRLDRMMIEPTATTLATIVHSEQLTH